MTASEFWLLLVAVLAAVFAYWVGRIDGYWRRAHEERERDMQEAGLSSGDPVEDALLPKAKWRESDGEPMNKAARDLMKHWGEWPEK